MDILNHSNFVVRRGFDFFRINPFGLFCCSCNHHVGQDRKTILQHVTKCHPHHRVPEKFSWTEYERYCKDSSQRMMQHYRRNLSRFLTGNTKLGFKCARCDKKSDTRSTAEAHQSNVCPGSELVRTLLRQTVCGRYVKLATDLPAATLDEQAIIEGAIMEESAITGDDNLAQILHRAMTACGNPPSHQDNMIHFFETLGLLRRGVPLSDQTVDLFCGRVADLYRLNNSSFGRTGGGMRIDGMVMDAIVRIATVMVKLKGDSVNTEITRNLACYHENNKNTKKKESGEDTKKVEATLIIKKRAPVMQDDETDDTVSRDDDDDGERGIEDIFSEDSNPEDDTSKTSQDASKDEKTASTTTTTTRSSNSVATNESSPRGSSRKMTFSDTEAHKRKRPKVSNLLPPTITTSGDSPSSPQQRRKRLPKCSHRQRPKRPFVKTKIALRVV
jgi:hypothetical protein